MNAPDPKQVGRAAGAPRGAASPRWCRWPPSCWRSRSARSSSSSSAATRSRPTGRCSGGCSAAPDRIAASLARSTPFIGTALAVAFAFRAGLFNIGAEGQILVGATLAAWVGTFSYLQDVPGILLIPIVIAAGAVGGGLWGAIPGVLKATTGAHEVIVTIMLNSIAVLYVRWLVSSDDPVILKDTTASVPHTVPISDERSPARARTTASPRCTLGLLLMLGAVRRGVVHPEAHHLRLRGEDRRRQRPRGPLRRDGRQPHDHRGDGARRVPSPGWPAPARSPAPSASSAPGVFVGIGFDAIAIALLAPPTRSASSSPSFLWGSMLSGAGLMQQETGLSIDVVRIIQALVLLFVAADVIVRTIFRLRVDTSGGAMDTTQLSTGWGST